MGWRAGPLKIKGSQQKGFILEELTWCEVAEALRSPFPVALLPLGSTEAHGPHLPLGTDAMISREMVLRAACELRRKGINALILPSVSYGVSYFASPFAGTIPVSQATLISLVQDICLSVLDMGFATICLCTAHLEPAHFEGFHKVREFIKQHTGVTIGVPDNRDAEWAAQLGEEFRKGARHAGSYETSLLLAADPVLVRQEICRNLPPVWIDLPAKARSGAKTFREAGSDQAYFGDPAQASVKEGEAYFDALAQMVVSTVESLLQERKANSGKEEQ